MASLRTVVLLLAALSESAFAFQPRASRRALAGRRATGSKLRMALEERSTTEKNKATSIGPATILRKMRVDIPWLAEGDAPPSNKVNIPDHVKAVLAQPAAPKRVRESVERVARVRGRAQQAADDARAAQGMDSADSSEWYFSPPPSPRQVTQEEPLRVLVAGGGLAGLVTAAACEAKGMQVAVFEQASAYAPYGGPIQIQSNALRALQRINPVVYEELVKAGTCTADRVSGLKIGYRRGNKLAGIYDKGDWLVRFDTVGPALEAGLPATVVVDRPVIQQIMLKHGIKEGAVKIKSRIVDYENLPDGGGVKATLDDGTLIFGDVLVGADGVWSSVRKVMHKLGTGANGFAASGAAGGAIDDAEARKLARDTVKIAAQASRRFSGFTCYAALANIEASNIEEVSYQILLGSDKYFVSTDGGGNRQQWFALIRDEVGGVDPEPTEEEPYPKLARLRKEFCNLPGGDQNGDVWDDFAMELIAATPEGDIKRRDLFDGAPLLDTLDPKRLWAPWSDGCVAICGDAAHPMMPNLGQGGCQAIEDAITLAEEISKIKTRDHSEVSAALSTYKDRRLVRSASVQGLSRFASDIIIRGFDTPAKIVDGEFQNFNYAGIVTRILQPILPVFFTIQFAFLYSGYRNEVGVKDVANGAGLALFGSLLLLGFAAVAADAGLLLAFGFESASALFEALSTGGFLDAAQTFGAEVSDIL